MTGVQAGGRLVGREAALAATEAALADAVAGSGGLLLVSGEPGIGKSALLAEQVRRAAAAGVRVLRGAGWAGAGAPPYWLFTQVLRGFGHAEMLEGAQTSDGLDHPPHLPRDRFLLFDTVRGALAAAAPMLVALDDLQWADTESIRLLEFLHRTLTAERVLLLAAYRDDEAGPALQTLAATAPGLPLSGLTVDGVAALMAAVAGPAPAPDLAAAVRARCGGNPLFVRELTRLMVARGDLSVAPALPDSVRDTLRLRLDRLSPPCRELLAVAAVAGPAVSPAVLAAVGPADELTVAELADEAERARVVVTSAAELRFSHDLYRESVLAALSPERRARLHAAVGHALIRLSGDGADPAAAGGAARLAAQFAAGGPEVAREALLWTVRAAEEATNRLGHEDAAGHYDAALRLLPADDTQQRIPLLLGLAAAWQRAGETSAARAAYLRAADLARHLADPQALVGAALGIASLGASSGTDDPVGTALLEEAVALPPDAVPAALCSRAHAALARGLRHGSYGLDPRAVPMAAQAVALARASEDTRALAQALHAEHDVGWRPGTSGPRLVVLDEMATAARTCGDAELAAEAVLLQAAALIERGDPEGLERLGRYVRLAERLGTAGGRWGALSRRATIAQMTGRVEDAVKQAEQARELGNAIGLPDAEGVYATLRSSLCAIGGPPVDTTLPDDDPMWPLQPLLRAWQVAQAGDQAAATASLRSFSVQTIPVKYDLELVAITTMALVAAGTPEQQAWAYTTFLPFAGLHAVVGGCAAYHGVVDHYLGMLAEALGRRDDAVRHLTAAVALQELLGTTAWAQRSRNELARLTGTGRADATFRLTDGRWLLAFDGRRAHVPDAKGMHDIARLLGAPGRPVHVFTLLGRAAPAAGADPVLDRRAAAAIRARLDALAEVSVDAEAVGDTGRRDRARAEREAITKELRAATGLGGRARRLGDETERARKTVSARVRDALRRIQTAHPALAAHLAQALRTGTHCVYLPDPPLRWRL